ncbi:chromate efflux transporter [Phaeobacter sp.]|uniref:chromate efflux transporter n=1 Tax=Phaeobacter sp. TaxID=1902409 RepID=UPI0025D225BE|nr:chromate efflux transporter [Phaeobacter sp.]
MFAAIGVLSFGGPAAQIALMHRVLVEEQAVLSEAEFLRALSFCMMLPGPEAMQLATYAGWRIKGAAGGLIGGLLFVLPGASVVAALAFVYIHFGTQDIIQQGFSGIKAAVVTLVFVALYKLSRKALTGTVSHALAAAAFVALFVFDLPFPAVILLAGLTKALLHQNTTTTTLHHANAAPTQEVARQTAAKSRTTSSQSIQTLLIWATLWLLPLLTLSAYGPALLADIGWFFAKLAVISFGGAYAVLAYMSQTVVSDFGWITTGQMIDALGLAETTPGPLILVTQFVAMLAGAAEGSAAMAVAAGIIALWATFLPCFLWIFLAAPHIESLAALPRLSAALQGVSAAVVGVILNLSVWFLQHVIFAETQMVDTGIGSMTLPLWSSLDPTAAGLVLLAPAVMAICRSQLIIVLAVMAGAGVVAHALV